MLEEFILDIKSLYERILNGERPSLIEFKNKWEIKRSIGEAYQKLSKRQDKKETGSFYTPYEVVDFMVTELVKNIDLKNNPNTKILDPSCGGGYFLIDLIDRLSTKMLGVQARDSSPTHDHKPQVGQADGLSAHSLVMRDSSPSQEISNKLGMGNENTKLNGTHKFDNPKITDDGSYENLDKIFKTLLDNNIYGFDIDENAVMISIIEIYDKTGHAAKNIVVRDFLLEDEEEYDYIIGNPPYMGHKVIKGEYRELLKEKYSEVFSDKGDLAYCFLKKSIDSLGPGGKLNFFTSRYILEALNGADIRKYLLDKGQLRRLIDFYGVRVVKGAGIDTIIIEFIKDKFHDCIDFYRLKNSAKEKGYKVFQEISEMSGHRGQFTQETELIKNIKINGTELDKEGWIFLTQQERKIIDKIDGVPLGDICDSFQGIITGCDDAFVIGREEAEKLKIEETLLKPWIKGKSINRFMVERDNQFLIYTNSIEEKELYPGAIYHISKEKGRLEKRRECVRGVRRWFDLQWGRDARIFEGVKIVFPYKASNNRFAVDKGSFFSADVYALKLKDNLEKEYSYEFLVGTLNSRIYEFYIKTMAKKLGEDLYEYYPNKIMKIKMPRFIKEIEDEVKKGSSEIGESVDRILLDYYGISNEEYKVIRGWCR